MAFSVITVRDAVVTIMTSANTTTASQDVSSGLTNRVVLISKGNPDSTPVLLTQYPFILVQPVSKDEEPSSLGRTTRRDIQAELMIYAGTQISTGEHEDEIYKLSNNIESVLRNNIDLSGAVGWCSPVSTEWSTDTKDDIEIHTARIKLITKSIGQA